MARRNREPAARRRIGLTAIFFYVIGGACTVFWLAIMKYAVIEDHAYAVYSIFNPDYTPPKIAKQQKALSDEHYENYIAFNKRREAATVEAFFARKYLPDKPSNFVDAPQTEAEAERLALAWKEANPGELHTEFYKWSNRGLSTEHVDPVATRETIQHGVCLNWEQDVEGRGYRLPFICPQAYLDSVRSFEQKKYEKAYSFLLAAAESQRATVLKQIEDENIKKAIDLGGRNQALEASLPVYRVQGVAFFVFGALILSAGWWLASMPRYGLIGGRSGGGFIAEIIDGFKTGYYGLINLIPIAFFLLFWFGGVPWFLTRLAAKLGWPIDAQSLFGAAWQAAIVFAVPILFFLVPFGFQLTKELVKDHRLYRRFFVFGKGGAARWAGVRDFIRYDFTGFMKNNARRIFPDTRQGPIYLGRSTIEQDLRLGGRDIGLDSDAHMLTVGVQGSGKSRDVLHNNLLTWPHGVLVFDPKGEHVRRTLKRRAAFRPAHVLDPYGVVSDVIESDCFNPLDEIDPAHPQALEDVQTLAEACVVEEHQQGEHFRDNAITIYQGVIVHVLTAYPEKQRHLGTVYDIITTGGPEEDVYNPKAFAAVLDAMRGNNAMGGLPIFAVGILDRVGEKERGSFFSTLARGIKWLATPVMRANTERSTFRLSGLKANKESVYVVLPHTRIMDQARWMRILATIAINVTVHTTPAKGCEKHRTLFVFDEFYQLGKFDPVAKGLSILRQSKIKVWMFVQYLEQLDKTYGGLGDFLNNCDKQFFGIEDAHTAKIISELLGTYRMPYLEGQQDQTRFHDPVYDLRPLAEVTEELEQDSPMQYVFPLKSKPLLLTKRAFFDNFATSQYGEVPEHLHGGRPPPNLGVTGGYAAE